jgi:multidrug efflux pump subunit AcrA (membrane-fusion protein)
MASRAARRALTPLLLALVLIPLAACGGRNASNSSAAPAATSTPAPAASGPGSGGDVRKVRVVQLRQGALTAQRSASVTIDPARSSMVAAGTSGQVAAVLHREGATVKAGETVVQLDTTSLKLQLQNAKTALESANVSLDKAQQSAKDGLAQAQAALDAAQQNLSLAQRQVDNGQNLYAAGGISATDLQSLQAQLAQARSSYQQARDAVDRAQRAETEDLQLQRLQVQQAQTQLDQARHTLDEASITAPFDGQIADMRVSEGEFVGTGSAVFRLVSTTSQLARFDVPPQDAQQLSDKGLVYVSYGGLDYAAKIVRSTTVTGSARQVELTASVYASKHPMPIGATGQVNYQVTLASGLLLPSDALKTDSGESTVLLVKDGVATQTKVQLLAEVGGTAAIQGLAAGAQVVYPVPSDLLAGSKVQVVGGATSP